MIRRRRLIAVLAVAAVCAPGTWLRSEVSEDLAPQIDVALIQGASHTSQAAWAVEGVWHYSTAHTRSFGGYSALVPLGSGRLRAFSDRGFRLSFAAPDHGNAPTGEPPLVSRQPVGEARLAPVLFDIESAARDAQTGEYWIGYENAHAIHRFGPGDEAGAIRWMADEFDWAVNGGLEAMARLADGRFLAIPEGKDYALIFASDPVASGDARSIQFANPAPDYAVTDIAQLPDGRILLLMRNLAWDGVPPFESLIAIGDPPTSEQAEPWAPEIALRLEGVLPRENYEGIAIEPRGDGRVTVWLISDDNLSAIQRTLLARLRFDPARADQ